MKISKTIIVKINNETIVFNKKRIYNE